MPTAPQNEAISMGSEGAVHHHHANGHACTGVHGPAPSSVQTDEIYAVSIALQAKMPPGRCIRTRRNDSKIRLPSPRPRFAGLLFRGWGEAERDVRAIEAPAARGWRSRDLRTRQASSCEIDAPCVRLHACMLAH
jgi:hypothetical protein